MSERMFAGSNKAGYAQYNCSPSMNELNVFSASEKEELREKLNSCLPPEMMISWIEAFVNAKVKEEILLSHKNPLTGMDRNTVDGICTYESRSLELRFSNNVSSLVLTKENIKGEDSESLLVSLFDSCGKEVNSGPGSTARVHIVVLEGDFDWDGRDSCTSEEFDQRVIGEVEGRNSLLVGNVCLNLINGTGCVPDIYFKSKSSWMKKTRFRLGARLADASMGIRVKEAMTNPFDVRDKRKDLYKSHDIPSLCDDVWRLHMIGRNGEVHKRLVLENINTVKDFLDIHFTNAKKLQEIFRRSAKNLKNALIHARTCPDKLMYNTSGLEPKNEVVFNVSGEVVGLVSDGKLASSDMLSETEKDLADNLVTYAFKHWGVVNVIPFEDQKYLVRCSSNASPTDNELVTPNDWSDVIKELFREDIPVYSDPPYHGLEPLTSESNQPLETEVIRLMQNLRQELADNVADSKTKAYKSWKMVLFSVRLLLKKKYSELKKKYSETHHVDKKPKLY